MPQMKPMNWFSLYLLFNILIMMMNIILYFNFKKFINNKNYSLKKKINNWKW